MGQTTTTIAPAIQDYVQELVPTLDSNVTPLRNLVPGFTPPSGDSADWRILYSGNSSTTAYAEGDAASASGNALFASPTIAASTSGVYQRTVRAATGHAIDQARGGYFDPIMADAENAIEEHLKGIEAFHVTTIEAAIDSAGSYGGLLRATYNLDSYEAAVATLALSDLQLMHETLVSEPIAMDPNKMVYLSDVAMLNEYLDVAPGSGAGIPIVTQADNSTIDGGKHQFQAQYNGRPWIVVTSMTATTILCVQMDLFRRIVWRPVTVEVKASTDDSITFHITSAELMYYLNPRKAGKLT
jgi:hypothetical protein